MRALRKLKTLGTLKEGIGPFKRMTTNMDPAVFLYLVPALMAVMLLWYLLPFANRPKLLKKFADRAPSALSNVSLSGESLEAYLRGRQFHIHILESYSTHLSNDEISRRKVHTLKVTLKLSGFPSDLMIERDTLGATLRAQEGQEELNFDDQDFDDAFWVTASQEKEARDCLTPEFRKYLAYYFGREKIELSAGLLQVSRSYPARFGVHSISRAVRPFVGLVEALDRVTSPSPRSGFILRAQLRSWALPVSILGWLSTILAPAEPWFQTVATYLFYFSQFFAIYLLLGIPGGKSLFRLCWPLIGGFAIVCRLVVIWQSPAAWYLKVGHLAALALFGILIWLGWKDIGRRG